MHHPPECPASVLSTRTHDYANTTSNWAPTQTLTALMDYCGHGEGPFDIDNSEVQPKPMCWFSISRSCTNVLVAAACCATAALFTSIYAHLSTDTSRSTGWHGKDSPRLSGAWTAPSRVVQVKALEDRTRLDIRIRVHLHVEP